MDMGRVRARSDNTNLTKLILINLHTVSTQGGGNMRQRTRHWKFEAWTSEVPRRPLL